MNALWQSQNKDQFESCKADWRAKSHEKIAAANANWRLKNIDSIKIKQAAWQAANPEACRINRQNRRARQNEPMGILSHGLSEKLFRLQKGMCPCCSQPLGDNFHLDHIVPLALGGSHADGNIQLLRARCNLQKHAKDPIDFMQSRGFLL